MKPTVALLRDYELELERLEVVHPEIECENRAEIPVSTPAPRAYAAAPEQKQMGGRA